LLVGSGSTTLPAPSPQFWLLTSRLLQALMVWGLTSQCHPLMVILSVGLLRETVFPLFARRNLHEISVEAGAVFALRTCLTPPAVAIRNIPEIQDRPSPSKRNAISPKVLVQSVQTSTFLSIFPMRNHTLLRSTGMNQSVRISATKRKR
jgi:hypothetical protein